MVFGTIEILASIVVALAVIKFFFIFTSPNKWLNFAKKVYAKPKIVSYVSLILAAVVLYYLVLAGIGIIEILAVMAFLALLIASSLAAYMKKLMKGIDFKDILKVQWLPIVAWVALIIWGIVALFF